MPRRRPGKLYANKGYGYRRRCAHLKCRGIKDRIARKVIERNDRLGRHRWMVERTQTDSPPLASCVLDSSGDWHSCRRALLDLLCHLPAIIGCVLLAALRTSCGGVSRGTCPFREPRGIPSESDFCILVCWPVLCIGRAKKTWTVQFAKRTELRSFKALPQRWIVGIR